MSDATFALVGCAASCTAIKIAGPMLLGGRSLPTVFDRVVSLLAPVLLAALVATQSLAVGHRLALSGTTVGVAASGVVAWRTGSAVAAVVTPRRSRRWSMRRRRATRDKEGSSVELLCVMFPAL